MRSNPRHCKARILLAIVPQQLHSFLGARLTPAHGLAFLLNPLRRGYDF